MEKVEIYNKLREKTGVVKGRHSLNKGDYRISAHIWIVNTDGRLLIQKKSELEDNNAGLWAQTAGGVKAFDSSKQTVFAECYEELKLTVKENEISYVGSYIRTNDFVDVWLVEKYINIDKLVLQPEEVAEIKLVSFEEFEHMITQGIVVPSINPSYTLLKNYYFNYRNK